MGHFGGLVPIIKDPLGISTNFIPIEFVKLFALSSVEAKTKLLIIICVEDLEIVLHLLSY